MERIEELEIWYREFILFKTINEWIWERQRISYERTWKRMKEQNETFNKLKDFNEDNILRILWKQLIARKWGSVTYNHHLKNLKAFWKWLNKKRILENNPIEETKKRKESKKIPKTLTKEQTKELLKELPKIFWRWDFTDIRNETMVKTYLYTWWRLSEIMNIELEDLNIDEDYIKIKYWKWDKQRIIPLHKNLKKDLKEYLKRRNDIYWNWWYLFNTVWKKALQKRDSRLIIEKIRKGISFKFTWHQLRHTFATALIKNNFDVYNVSQILGHAKIETTKIYLSLDTEKFRNKLNKIELY